MDITIEIPVETARGLGLPVDAPGEVEESTLYENARALDPATAQTLYDAIEAAIGKS